MDILNARYVPPAPLDYLPPGFMILPSSADAYWRALEALPPSLHQRAAFLMGEPSDHRLCLVTSTVLPAWTLYAEHDRGVFVRGSLPLTIPEATKMLSDPDLKAYRAAFLAGRLTAT